MKSSATVTPTVDGRLPAGGPTIAVMQPYFIPYAGYFRLFAASDLFVIYDCVQFTRRGWLHRNKFRDFTGKADWLTLPLRKAPQDVLIKDLAFRDDAHEAFVEQARRFPTLECELKKRNSDAARLLLDFSGTPVDYIVRLLEWAAVVLDLPWRTVRSSALDIDPSKRGEERILAIAATLGASRYVNAPGGVNLYNASSFTECGIDLRFLPDFPGGTASILERLLTEDVQLTRAEILASL